jgi:hypothetical protein
VRNHITTAQLLRDWRAVDAFVVGSQELVAAAAIIIIIIIVVAAQAARAAVLLGALAAL